MQTDNGDIYIYSTQVSWGCREFPECHVPVICWPGPPTEVVDVATPSYTLS